MATKKTAAKKATATKKAPATRSTTKKATTKKVAASAGDDESSGPSRSRSARGSAPRAAAQKKRRGTAIAAEAAQQLVELTGREVEGVTGLSRSDDGWIVEVEVLEVRRIPDTTDVLALYELTVDEDGELEGYRRIRRYVRGKPGEESGR